MIAQIQPRVAHELQYFPHTRDLLVQRLYTALLGLVWDVCRHAAEWARVQGVFDHRKWNWRTFDLRDVMLGCKIGTTEKNVKNAGCRRMKRTVFVTEFRGV
jgi:hypothetical protein